jgi:hypothetical protein
MISRRTNNMKPTVTKLLDSIQKVLKRDGKTLADLARELVSDEFPNGRDYHQVYDWFVRRQFNPQAEALMQLMGWYEKNKISVRGKRAAPAHT